MVNQIETVCFVQNFYRIIPARQIIKIILKFERVFINFELFLNYTFSTFQNIPNYFQNNLERLQKLKL